MTASNEFPNAEFDRVYELVDLVKHRIEEGPFNHEWLLDYNLPDLYVAIAALYETLGESKRLAQRLQPITPRQ